MQPLDLFGNAKVAELAYVLPSAPTDPDAHARCWVNIGYRLSVANVGQTA